MHRYFVYDVFTETRFGGNQLAVFPESESLPEGALQSIAAEFNFSEVTFIYPPSDPNHTARVRIFTPTMEIPFAGHPTIGTAKALADMGHGPDMVLELGIGPLSCNAGAQGARFTTQAPLERIASPDPALVARALDLSLDQIDQSQHAPTLASVGLPFTLTALKTRADLAACQPDMAAFREGAKAHPQGLDFAQFAYVREGDTCHARMFAPLDNIPEDPATGSACAAFAAFLYELEGTPLALTVQQGEDMGRPSTIHLSADGTSVTVAGQAVRVMEGTLL
ncbi:PhzF family phenazine biosynthesis protein [Roseovarius sp. A21]|uniref:PhzF family phenazine biosynthesis protein n=1 Tax=Roseovarius bejariae TaxID=2576383 RepID=A0A844D3K2_9RHOB|nr:PhzF family phenazine biosynthesis protein [Roseovarius bejariae]MRU16784.1 PhzF family phenazine biosynthesis protein [Roseovarius bejariae]